MYLGLEDAAEKLISIKSFYSNLLSFIVLSLEVEAIKRKLSCKIADTLVTGPECSLLVDTRVHDVWSHLQTLTLWSVLPVTRYSVLSSHVTSRTQLTRAVWPTRVVRTRYWWTLYTATLLLDP